VKYIQDYAANGITVKYVGFLNEPDLNTTYASMQSDGRQAADFIEVLYPTLAKAGLKTQIACCDGSGWQQNRERLTGIQLAGDENKLGLVTAHGYSDYPSYPFNTTKHVRYVQGWLHTTLDTLADSEPINTGVADRVVDLRPNQLRMVRTPKRALRNT